jgi:hypothetical protein
MVSLHPASDATHLRRKNTGTNSGRIILRKQKKQCGYHILQIFEKQGRQQFQDFVFNRNRAVIDYQMTSNTYLPQFGFTEAFSFNHPSLKGFAPVGVVQIFGTGVFAKAGIQFARINTHSTFFSWIVCETLQSPAIDLFFLGRYTPPLTEKWNLFLQLELVNAFPSNQQKNFSFTQRARAGLKHKAFQFGLGSDYSQTGRGAFSTLLNTGGFIRYEF